MSNLWSKFRNALRAFGRAREGNVAVLFGIAAIPVIGMVGAAVDYGHANSVKAAMQAALDSTALMLSREASGLSQDDLNSKALAYFNAMFTRPEIQPGSLTIDAVYSTTGGSSVTVTGHANVPTSFVSVIGFPQIAVGGLSVSRWGSSRLRVALVLDNTGSMADNGKIDALKTATTNLLTQLQNAASVDGDVYVSIVPFVKDVSVDASGYTPSWDSWIMWDDGVTTADHFWDSLNGTCSKSGNSYNTRSKCVAASQCSIAGNNTQNSCQNAGVCSISGNNNQNSCTSDGTCSISGNNSQNSCTSAGTCSLSGYNTQNACLAAGTCSNPGQTDQNSCVNNKACSNPTYTSKNQCTSHGGTWAKGSWASHPGTWTAGVWTAGVWTAGVWSAAKWTPDAHSTWNGCFTDRGTVSAPGTNAGYDQDATAPTTSIPATLFPAEQYGSCPAAVMGLNYNWDTMKTLVSNMVANGNTNQPIGLQWGWQSLAGGGPFSVPAMDSNYQYSQVIILLSDGLNTQDRWYSTQGSIDKRMWDSATGNGTCANIKAAGITIYTIQVNTGGDPTSTLLQNCASNATGTTDHFFLLTSADQMVTTFQKIGTNLTKLRVAQ